MATENRKVVLTKQVIENTLFELLDEKPLEKITVKELCEAADINRSTFYRHYTDVFDLMEQITRRTMEELKSYLIDRTELNDPSAWRTSTRAMLEYAQQNRTLFLLLFQNKTGWDCWSELIQMNRDLFHVPERSMMNYSLAFSIYGSVAVSRRWLESGCWEPIEEVVDFLLDIMTHGFHNE